MTNYCTCLNPQCDKLFNKTKTPASLYCNRECKKKHFIKNYESSPNRCKNCLHAFQYEEKHKSFCNNSCAGTYNGKKRKHTDETKAKIRNSRINNPTGCIENSESYKKSLETKRKNSSRKTYSFSCMKCNKNVVSKTKKYYCSKDCWSTSGNCGGFRVNSTRKIQSTYKNYKMDSNAELQFAILLDNNNISWIKNTTKFFEFIDSNGKTRKYYPDFYLPYYDIWVEIKGKYYIRQDDDKRRASVGNIILVMSDDIRSILAILLGIEPKS